MFQIILSQINENVTNLNIVPFILLLGLMSTILSICSPNPMVSLMFLILSFFSLSLLFLAVGLEFLSFLVLLVYVGSICILFIFVLMILNLKMLILKNYLYYKIYFISFFILSFIFLILVFLNFEFSLFFLYSNTLNSHISWSSIFFNTSDLESMGNILFKKYIFHFVIASIILFSVMVGSVSIVTQKKKVFLKLNYLKSNESDFLQHDFNKNFYLNISEINPEMSVTDEDTY